MKVQIQCSVHGTELEESENCSLCQASFDEQVKRYADSDIQLTIGGSHFTPKKYFIDKKEVELCHDTEYLEWYLPKLVYDRAEKFIEQELSKFESQCDCLHCIEKRER